MKRTVYIGIGGFLGAIARYGFKKIPIYGGGIFPVNTLLVNIAGCFALAFLLTVSFRILPLDSDRKAAFTTGFLGAFTTFSAFCRETADLFMGGFYLSALFYVGLSLLAGFAAVWFGQFAAGMLNTGNEVPGRLPVPDLLPAPGQLSMPEQKAKEMECGVE